MYIWTYGENENHRYYECRPQKKDYICVCANKFEGSNPNMYMILVEKEGSLVCIGDKKFNDRMREKYKNPAYSVTRPLQSEDVEYLKERAIYCYEHNKTEI